MTANNVKPMTRTKAALTHFAISVAVFSLFLSLVFFIWYAYPFNITQGVGEIVYLMAGVDVVLGPLLTFIVFKAGKKSLKFDLSFIAAVQVAALIYGAMVIYKERPAYIVFTSDRFEVVAASEVDMSNSPIPEQAVGIFDKPRFMFTEKLTGKAANDHLFAVLSGAAVDIDRMPEQYRDYSGFSSTVLAKLNSAALAASEFESDLDLSAHKYAPVSGKRKDIIVILDGKTAQPLEYHLVDPWQMIREQIELQPAQEKAKSVLDYDLPVIHEPEKEQ